MPKRLLLSLFFLASGCTLQGGSTSKPIKQDASMRIISLAPVATEYLFALGLGSSVVGVTTFCDRPIEVQNIPKIGGFVNPQLEAIIKLKPTLIVATPIGEAVAVVETLKSRGYKVLTGKADSLLDARSLLTTIGDATNKQSEAKAFQERIDAQYASLHQEQKKSARILWLVSSHSPLVAASSETFPGEVLSHLGFSNWIASSKTAWPMLSLEALLKNPPDSVVVSEGKDALNAARDSLAPLLEKYPKMKIIAPKHMILHRPGPYMVDEIKLLLSAVQESHV